MTRIYVIDSSSLINMHRQIPVDIFPSVWHKLESEINGGRLIAPKEVKEEVKEKRDELFEWIIKRPKMFVEDSDELRRIVVGIGEDWPDMVGDKKKHAADLWVIAQD